MSYTVGQDRNQITLIPECLDDFVGPGNPVRLIDRVVSSLDLKALGFKYAVSADTGRPPYDPADLLRLYIYGYLHGINSGRDLEELCQVNIHVMWLVKRIAPDYRTICAFRKNNGQAIEAAMVKFNEIWIMLGLIGSDTVAVDSSKFRAVNSKDNNYSEKKLKHLLAYYKTRIAEYMEKLEQADRQQQDEERKELTAQEMEEIQKKLEAFKRREEEHSQRLAILKETGQKQISTVDPDSRRMRCNDGTIVGYSAQLTIDSKNNMILDFEVTNAGNDTQQFEKMALRAKKLLQVEGLKVASDTGYYKAEAIINCEKAGIETHVSVPNPPVKNRPLFQKKDFIYDKENDSYTCPANQKLVFRGMVFEHGRNLRRYEPIAANTCRNCPLRSQCTTRKKKNRRITRFIDEEILEKAIQRNQANPDLRTLRKSMVEHPFGNIKTRINHGRFLTKGKMSVRTEFALAVIAYNLKRVFSILGGLLLTSLALAGFAPRKRHRYAFFGHFTLIGRKLLISIYKITNFQINSAFA